METPADSHATPQSDGSKADSVPPDQLPGDAKTFTLGAKDKAANVSDNQFLLLMGGLFFAIMVGQYLWKVCDKPQPLIWEAGPATAAFKVNINTASWAEWSQLQAIGPDMAKRIVADRDQNGEFRSIDDVGRVTGIGTSTLEQIRPLLTISKRPAKTLTPDGQSIEPAENQ